eukprot:228912-Ditylum_brightwellii.AAC.1
MLELQQAMRQTGYNTHYADTPEETPSAAEAIDNLARATEHDKAAMANLVEMNGNLTEQVANLTNKLNTKDQSIADLTAKIATLTASIEQLAKKHNRPNNRNNNNINNAVYYCWSHGVTKNPNHQSSSCQHPKEGHLKEVTFLNQMGGSTKGM